MHLALLNNVSVEDQTCKEILNLFVSGLCSGVFKVVLSKTEIFHIHFIGVSRSRYLHDDAQLIIKLLTVAFRQNSDPKY